MDGEGTSIPEAKPVNQSFHTSDECAFITQNTRILFHKAHLYKSFRFIFTCEKSLYSQSEWRTAISRAKV